MMAPGVLRRATLVSLLALLAFLLWFSRNPQALLTLVPIPGVAIEPTLGPTPPRPTIVAPHGALPTGHVAFEAWAQPAGGSTQRAGSGFLLLLANDHAIGVMTAHSLDWAASPQMLAFHLPQQSQSLIEFDLRTAGVGRAFTGYRFDVDFVVLPTDEPVDTALGLQPDARGGPQPGERVVLFSGSGDGAGNPRTLYGTVTAASAEAVWAQMDDVFDPASLSGSPLLSAHTGQVVGMAVAGRERLPMLLGFHPIGSLVEKATSLLR
jgi:hypothetical protein